MAENVSVIGRTTRVRGRVTGTADLEVQGFVEGDITVGGGVTVEAQGMVGSGIQARRVVVRGAVKGDLVGVESVSVEEGARVVGDVRAPRVMIAPGAMVRGFVESEGGAADGQARTARAQVAGRPSAASSRNAVTATPATKAAPPTPTVTVPAGPQARVTAAKHLAGMASSSSNHANAHSGASRRPPPPVVPALKRAKGQMAKRRER